MKQLAGHLDAKGLRFGIVLARWNSRVTDFLLNGAVDALVRHGAKEENPSSIALRTRLDVNGFKPPPLSNRPQVVNCSIN